mgnify:FL=1
MFSPFFFANHDTKTPFYISLISVILNIIISVYYFKSVGFIIIPIATTISSWFNSVILFIFLKNKELFQFNKSFLLRFIKIIFLSILMGIFFNYLIFNFEDKLAYDYYLKSFYLIISVSLGLEFYLVMSLLTKASKILNYEKKNFFRCSTNWKSSFR